MNKPIDTEILKSLRDAKAFIEAELDDAPMNKIDPDRLALMRVENAILKSMIEVRVKTMNVVAVKRRR
jgi:hypothetical protein